jgi:TonB family protein
MPTRSVRDWRSGIWSVLVMSIVTVPAIFAQAGLPDGAHDAQPAGSAPVQKGSAEVGRSGVPIQTPDPSVRPPKLTHSIDPKFSKEARKAKKGGIVVVGLMVDERGLPTDVHVTSGVGYGLDEEAAKAVKQYRFKPALKNGKPLAVEMRVEVHFLPSSD